MNDEKPMGSGTFGADDRTPSYAQKKAASKTGKKKVKAVVAPAKLDLDSGESARVPTPRKRTKRNVNFEAVESVDPQKNFTERKLPQSVLYIVMPRCGAELFYSDIADSPVCENNKIYTWAEYSHWASGGGNMFVNLGLDINGNNILDLCSAAQTVEKVVIITNSNRTLWKEIALLELSTGMRIDQSPAVSRTNVDEHMADMRLTVGVYTALAAVWNRCYPGDTIDIAGLWATNRFYWPHTRFREDVSSSGIMPQKSFVKNAIENQFNNDIPVNEGCFMEYFCRTPLSLPKYEQ
tara:strand:+ start:99 stop:980 length:882 start_codon:yes stop_codon:yes gene_type:complete